MDTINATDAKREFGDVLLRAQHGPVTINRNGKPVAVMLSAQEYAHLQAAHTAWLRQELQIGLDDVAAGRVYHDGPARMQAMWSSIKNEDI